MGSCQRVSITILVIFFRPCNDMNVQEKKSTKTWAILTRVGIIDPLFSVAVIDIFPHKLGQIL
jgi:hypothetical protein